MIISILMVMMMIMRTVIIIVMRMVVVVRTIRLTQWVLFPLSVVPVEFCGIGKVGTMVMPPFWSTTPVRKHSTTLSLSVHATYSPHHWGSMWVASSYCVVGALLLEMSTSSIPVTSSIGRRHHRNGRPLVREKDVAWPVLLSLNISRVTGWWWGCLLCPFTCGELCHVHWLGGGGGACCSRLPVMNCAMFIGRVGGWWWGCMLCRLPAMNCAMFIVPLGGGGACCARLLAMNCACLLAMNCAMLISRVTGGRRVVLVVPVYLRWIVPCSCCCCVSGRSAVRPVHVVLLSVHCPQLSGHGYVCRVGSTPVFVAWRVRGRLVLTGCCCCRWVVLCLRSTLHTLTLIVH